MTKEQAIRFAKHAQTMTEIQDVSDFYRMAECALRAKNQDTRMDRSRWEGCGCCNNLGDAKVYEFLYCPYCGKPITEEAWKQLERRIGGNDGKID